MHREADRKSEEEKGINTQEGLADLAPDSSPLTSTSQPRVAMHGANDKLPPSPGNQTTAGSMPASSAEPARNIPTDLGG